MDLALPTCTLPSARIGNCLPEKRRGKVVDNLGVLADGGRWQEPILAMVYEHGIFSRGQQRDVVYLGYLSFYLSLS